MLHWVKSFLSQTNMRQRTQTTLPILNLRAAAGSINCVLFADERTFHLNSFGVNVLLDISLIRKCLFEYLSTHPLESHATWQSRHVISIKIDQMRGGARPHRIHCAQLGEWMPAFHYASKWDATSKKKSAGNELQASPSAPGITANIYYSNSAVKYPTCYQNFTLKGEKTVCGRLD